MLITKRSLYLTQHVQLKTNIYLGIARPVKGDNVVKIDVVVYKVDQLSAAMLIIELPDVGFAPIIES